MTSEHIDKEYAILENIYHKPEKVRQRDLAHIAGISLGMTNAILKRLINKGLVIARKINHRTIHYAVTPSGINAIMQRSYRYFKRTIKNIVYYKEKIRELVHEIATKGYSKIQLAGESDLDFIVEHCVHQEGLALERVDAGGVPSPSPGTFIVWSEKTNRRTADERDHDISLFSYLHADAARSARSAL